MFCHSSVPPSTVLGHAGTDWLWVVALQICGEGSNNDITQPRLCVAKLLIVPKTVKGRVSPVSVLGSTRCPLSTHEAGTFRVQCFSKLPC